MNFEVFVIIIHFTCFSKSAELTTSEAKALQELRLLVENELYLPYMRTDAFLLRWLEDRKFNVNDAKAKLLKALKWRKENNVDNILNEKNPFVEEYMKFNVTSRDSLGNPVVTVDFSSWDIRRIALAGKLDLLNRHVTKMMETAASQSSEIQKEKPETNQWILFGNLNGFTLKKQGCLPCLPFYVEYIQTYENYFTGSSRYIIIVNAPRSFDSVASIARGVMSPGTRRAFKIYNTNREEWDFLDEIIPRDQLPFKHGGNKKRV